MTIGQQQEQIKQDFEWQRAYGQRKQYLTNSTMVQHGEFEKKI